MSRWTVDASVAVKWFVPEIHSEAAARWLDPRFELLTPDLLYPEVGNILWKKARQAELSAREVRAVCRGIARVPFRVWPSKELLGSALDAALALGRSVYDCTYLALAIGLEAPLVTADRRLIEAISGGSVKRYVRWIEDAP